MIAPAAIASAAAPVVDGQGGVIAVLQVLNKRGGASFNRADERHIADLACQVANLLADTSLGSQLRPENRQSLSFRYNDIVGESVCMREVLEQTARAAQTEATVLVRGESGSGLMTLRDLERTYVEHVLRACSGNRSAAARILRIGRNTLLRKLDVSAE